MIAFSVSDKLTWHTIYRTEKYIWKFAYWILINTLILRSALTENKILLLRFIFIDFPLIIMNTNI